MIKILKHGNKQKFTKICIYCGCEFEYELEDVHTDDTVSLTYYPGEYPRYVICPECEAHLSHNPTYNEDIIMPGWSPLTLFADGYDCEKCPNKPDFSKGPIIGDTPCMWCPKMNPMCTSIKLNEDIITTLESITGTGTVSDEHTE